MDFFYRKNSFMGKYYAELLKPLSLPFAKTLDSLKSSDTRYIERLNNFVLLKNGERYSSPDYELGYIEEMSRKNILKPKSQIPRCLFKLDETE